MSKSVEATPLVSVCIANYNGAEIIVDCIESVLAQDCTFPVEIIVHDDASTDTSIEIILECFPQARLLKSEENVGFCVSNNRMAAIAKGEYLLLLNNDATLMPDALATLMHYAQSLKEPAILSLPQYDDETGELIDAGCLLDLFLNPIPNHDLTRHDVGMVIGACFWIPNTLWEQLRGFPDWFGSLAEDMYLCCAARLARYPVIVINKSGYKHQVGQSLGGGKLINNRLVSKYSRRRLSERNKNFVMSICYPTCLLIFVLPFHLTLLLIEGAAIACINLNFNLFTTIYWNSIFSLWEKRQEILAHRKYIQSLRRISVRGFLKNTRLFPYKLQLLIRHGWPILK